MSVAVVWFRRDLRLADHPALIAALRRHDAVVPLYVFDDALLRGRWDSGNRRFFLRESLVALDESLRARGSRLVWRRGPVPETVAAVAREVGAQAVYVSRDYSPYARRRDQAVAAALGAHGVAFHAHPGVLVHEPEDVRKPDGSPYTVYTPYRRAWDRVALRPLAPTPDAIPTPPIDDPSPIPSLASLGGGGAATEIPTPSEAAAQQRLAAWARDGLRRYAGTRDRLDLAGTSRLSQDLRWGLLSPRQVIAACAGPDDDRQTFVGEIAWRDFYYHILYHFPRVATAAFQPRFDAIVWQATPDQIRAWQEGRTGYPVVDAAMRQLQA
ncbi:MAG: deoxyribodipyrimidine photo-lyase, partial [Dehalococcoidia bacterium]|nr:deoxyribodipyrimidine photo-lyase [Dehalococcoidia bacterium]